MRTKDKLLNGIWDTLDTLEQTSTGMYVEHVSNADLIKAHKLLVEALVIIATPIEAAQRKYAARKRK